MSDLLPPLKAVILANRQYWREDNVLRTHCPECGEDLWISEKSFVCLGHTCAFGRGSSMDYLARSVGGYLEALALASEEIPYYRERMESEARELKQRRALLEFAIRAERQNLDMHKERVRLRQEFSTYVNAPPSAFRRGHWFLTTAQSNELVLLLCELEIDPPPGMQGRPCAVAPFWGNLHSLGALYTLGSRSLDFHITHVFPYRFSWFGLQQMSPEATRVAVFKDYMTALRQEERYKICDHLWFPTCVNVNARAGLSGYRFDEHRYVLTPAEAFQLLPRWSLVEGFENAVFAVGSEEMTLIELMDFLLESSQVNFDSFLDLCQAMKLPQGLRAHLLRRADMMPRRADGENLRDTLSRRLLTVDEKGAIYEYPNGYFVEADNKLKQAANFTLKLEKMVCFSSQQESRYVGKAYFSGLELAFETTGPKLEQPGALEEMLRNQHTLALGSGMGTSATITHPKEFRRVLEALRIQRAELPRFIGVSSLGWNHRYDTFFFPNLIINRQGIHGNVSYHAEEAGEHHCWADNGPLPNAPPADPPEISPALAELISALIAQSLRLYHAKSTRLWPILNNDGRTNALKLFEGLGQTSVMRLTQFSPRNFDLNRGLPCLIALNNDLQAGKVRMAGAWLAERGQDLSKIDPAEIERASLLLPALLAEIVRRLTAGESVSYFEKRSVEPLSAIAEEGAALIRTDFWPTWPKAGIKWQAINTLLEVKEHVIPRSVTIDTTANALFFPCELWADLEMDPTNLAIELGLLNLDVRQKDKGISVDRPGMNRVFSEFYGKVPELLAL